MSYTKRQRNRKRRQAFRIIIISSIFLYLIFRSIPSLLANSVKTVLPEEGIFIETIKSNGVVLKHETLIKASNGGEFIPTAVEGDRLASGMEIGSINSLKDTSFIQQELLLIEESILALGESTKETSIIISEKEKVEGLTASIIDELQIKINLGKYEEIYLLKEQLALYEDKFKDISFSKTLVGQSLDNLEAKRDNLKDEINKNHIKYYTNHGGILSYELDGYEKVFLPKDFENYSYDKLNSIDKIENKNKKSNITVGNPFGKIIDNFQWYIALKVEDISKIEDFQRNQIINIYFEDREELKGRIVAINTTGNKGVIVAEFTTMLHDYYGIRFPQVEIIKTKKEGYKIPNQSIANKEGVTGVYIKDKSGIVRFRPVVILGTDSNHAYLDKDSISLFDEIFLSPDSAKEGQILN